jgi:arylsulfatase A-like enzyme
MPDRDFRSALITTWLRLATLGVLALVFTEALILAPGKAQGWSYYLTIPEVLFEVTVRLVAAALAGMALGTACALVLLPFLRFFPSTRNQLVDSATKVAVFLVIFLVSRYALIVLIKWSYSIRFHPAIFDKALLAAQFLIFAVALVMPRLRRGIVSSLDGCLSEKVTRRTALATVGGAAALVVTEYALSKTVPVVRAAVAGVPPKSNVLLITFDALNAEDMSLYGRRLPTTPNIDAFAQRATVFEHFYSASTFTTCSVATMMTGLYPSETLVYQLQGRVLPRQRQNSLPAQLRSAGYRTGGFLSNPFAYYLSTSLNTEFDVLPEPVFQAGGMQHLWSATTPLHQNTGVGSRIDEYSDLESQWNDLVGLPSNMSMRLRPVPTFAQASQILKDMPEGFFLWVHLISPHNPYLPDAIDRGRFLPPDKVTTYEEEFGTRWKPHYPSSQQPLVDERRLRYDEFIASADRAFGDFMAFLEGSGRQKNTTVIFSADHGESFEGGVYEHSSAYLTRPVIHVPLVIRRPDQQDSRRVQVTADQTSLAPTILDLAGVAAPNSMKGPSLAKWLDGSTEQSSAGMAFCQYFEKNSVFKPLKHGTVGVIDGEYQYVVYLDNQLGVLRPLEKAQYWDLDWSAAHPERAKVLREALRIRFPDLVQAKA